MSETRWGATPEDWIKFDLMLGLTEDLLPVVSNPNAVASPGSSLTTLGKVPSQYNRAGNVVGINKWTKHRTSGANIEKWSAVPDYGICLQTRQVRALDIDVEDKDKTRDIIEFIGGKLHWLGLPLRSRPNSAKCLVAFRVDGMLGKRSIKVDGGVIEFLGNGQQFIAAGTHPSGARYAWDFCGWEDFPILSIEQFESLWAALVSTFGVGDVSSSGQIRKENNSDLTPTEDPLVPVLMTHESFRGTGDEDQIFIECPFKHEHTGDSGKSETAYFPAGSRGYLDGRFVCQHAHCAGRLNGEFESAMGLYVDDFEDLGDAGVLDDSPVGVAGRFPLIDCWDFVRRPRPDWIIKGIIPRAELAVIYGESGAGKSFLAIDMAMAIARGVDWNGRKVIPGRVVYIAAEGAGGVRNRLEAYAQKNGVGLNGYPLQLIAGVPNLLQQADVVEVTKSILTRGPADVIIIDTFAQVTVGGDENRGEDMGRAISNCKAIHRQTGALVVPVHHTGKDLTRGLRGWSGIKGALDASLEVARAGEVRSVRIDKQKEGEDGEEWGFRLIPATIAVDEDGDPITSCYFEFTGLPVNARAGRDYRGREQRARSIEPRGVWQIRVADAFGAICAAEGVGEVEIGRVRAEVVLGVVGSMGAADKWRYKQKAVDAIDTLIHHKYFVLDNDKNTLKLS